MDLEMQCRDLLDDIEDFQAELRDTQDGLAAHKRRVKEIMRGRGYLEDAWPLLEEVRAFLAKKEEGA